MSAEAFSNQAESTQPEASAEAGDIQDTGHGALSAEAMAAAEGKPPRNGKAGKSDKAEKSEKSEKHTPMMAQRV